MCGRSCAPVPANPVASGKVKWRAVRSGRLVDLSEKSCRGLDRILRRGVAAGSTAGRRWATRSKPSCTLPTKISPPQMLPSSP